MNLNFKLNMREKKSHNFSFIFLPYHVFLAMNTRYPSCFPRKPCSVNQPSTIGVVPSSMSFQEKNVYASNYASQRMRVSREFSTFSNKLIKLIAEQLQTANAQLLCHSSHFRLIDRAIENICEFHKRTKTP